MSTFNFLFQGGLRQELSEHVWPETQTLQFDKKKFVIVASRDGMQTEAIFYTDHHTKYVVVIVLYFVVVVILVVVYITVAITEVVTSSSSQLLNIAS